MSKRLKDIHNNDRNVWTNTSDNLGGCRFHSNEEMELAIREWLRNFL
jgi:hypothetical protein